MKGEFGPRMGIKLSPATFLPSFCFFFLVYMWQRIVKLKGNFDCCLSILICTLKDNTCAKKKKE